MSDFNILFVAPLSQRYAQHELVEVANIYRYLYEDFTLHILCISKNYFYEKKLLKLMHLYGLQEYISLQIKPSKEELTEQYKNADLFLSLSEDEHFKLPKEIQLFNIPLLSFKEKSFKHIAASIELVRESSVLRRELLLSNAPQQQLGYRFEGPFDSSYSLALLNRESALAYDKKHKNSVALYSTEGGGDFEPDKSFLQAHPEVNRLYQNSKQEQSCRVVFRNLYPPRVASMRGIYNLLNAYGWEESVFPKEYVAECNKHLDGITVMSQYVRKVLRDSGVSCPIAVVSLGSEHILKPKSQKVTLQTQKSFKFLHISSCFERKGVDTLLEAYTSAFSADDDVTLIIKTFPNPHNNIEEQIQNIQKENAPEILLINQDLADEHIKWLYENCNTLVAPSRGEGFGLPMAEAMLFDMPVITTGFGGQSDFCTEQTSWLIEYSFSKAQTHMKLFNSYWVEPSTSSLASLMLELSELSTEQKKVKTDRAKEHILKEFSWEQYVNRSDSFIEQLHSTPLFEDKEVNIAWVSSYNSRCGIATYSEFLLKHIEKKHQVTKYASYTPYSISPKQERTTIRCWGNREDKDLNKLTKSILANKTSHVLINFNFAFFSMANLESMLQELHMHNIKISIIFHSVEDVTIKGSEASLGWISKSLQKVQHLLVHSIKDLNTLKSFDLVQNVTLFPHGVQKRKSEERSQKKACFTIASYGFMLPHKGIGELIEAFCTLHKKYPHTRLLLVNALHPDPISKRYLQECKNRIQEYKLNEHVELIHDFLQDDASFAYLDKADLLVMPYRETQESASGAVRYALSTRKPVLCTPIPIFEDIEDIVHFTHNTTAQAIYDKIAELLYNPQLLQAKREIQTQWLQEHDWEHLASRLLNIIKNP